VYIEMFADMRRVRRGSNFGALWAMAMTDSMALWLFWMYLYLYLNLCLCLCLCPTLTCFRFLYGCSLDWGLACFQHLTAAVKKKLERVSPRRRPGPRAAQLGSKPPKSAQVKVGDVSMLVLFVIATLGRLPFFL